MFKLKSLFGKSVSGIGVFRSGMHFESGKGVPVKVAPRPPVSHGATFGNFGQLLHWLHSPTGMLSDKCIGRASTRTPAPRRCQAGRTLLEMLAVLAIIGVLSVAALMGFRYALDKHKANSIYQDVHLLALHVMDTGKDTVPSDFYPQSGMIFGIDTTTYANGFVVTVSDVSEKVCDKIMAANDTSIEEVYVGSEGHTTCSGSQTMGFMFLYDGSLSSGGGTSGGSGSGEEPEDPCAGMVCQHGGSYVDGMCHCVNGYTGDYCEIEPNLCADVVLTACQASCDPVTGLIVNQSDGTACTTSDNQSGTCLNGICEASSSCEDGIEVIGKNGHAYCRSHSTMNWEGASAYCITLGRTLATMEQLCNIDDTQKWDGSTGNGKCLNLKASEGYYLWSATPHIVNIDTFVFVVHTENGNVTDARSTKSYYAVCW